MKEEIDAYKGCKLILFINIFYITISYLYALIRKEYNGDFLDIPVNLNPFFLSFVWIISIIPFLGLWLLYKKYKKKHIPYKKVYISIGFVKMFVFILLISHIFVTLVFGVGKAGFSVYQAPSFIKFFIQILLRFDSTMWGVFLIFICSKKDYTTLLWTILLLSILGITRASMGFLFFTFWITIIKYNKELLHFLKKYFFIICIIIPTFPFFVEFAYNQRDILRKAGDGNIKYDKNTLLAGKLVGRLSSFSNTAILIDKGIYYYIIAQDFDTFFYQKNMLIMINGSVFSKKDVPEKVLIENGPENASFMLGTSGILIFSLYKSTTSFFINLFSIIIICILVFKILKTINFSMNNEYAFFILLGPGLSGVGLEYFACLLNAIILFITLLFFRAFKKLQLN